MELSFQKERGSGQWGAEALGTESTSDLISTEVSCHVLCSDVVYIFPLDVGDPSRSESSPLPVPFVTYCFLDRDPPPSSSSSYCLGCPWDPPESLPRDVSVVLRSEGMKLGNPLSCHQNTVSSVKDKYVFRSHSVR